MCIPCLRLRLYLLAGQVSTGRVLTSPFFSGAGGSCSGFTLNNGIIY